MSRIADGLGIGRTGSPQPEARTHPKIASLLIDDLSFLPVTFIAPSGSPLAS